MESQLKLFIYLSYIILEVQGELVFECHIKEMLMYTNGPNGLNWYIKI